MRTPELYNETHQTRSKPPTAYENLLGDAIERAYAQAVSYTHLTLPTTERV